MLDSVFNETRWRSLTLPHKIRHVIGPLNASVGSVKLVLEIKKAKEIYCGDVSDY